MAGADGWFCADLGQLNLLIRRVLRIISAHRSRYVSVTSTGRSHALPPDERHPGEPVPS